MVRAHIKLKVLNFYLDGKETAMALRVGKPAPEFEANAYENGEIHKIKLTDYRGQWVMLYFYPGDFTFV